MAIIVYTVLLIFLGGRKGAGKAPLLHRLFQKVDGATVYIESISIFAYQSQ